MSHHETLPELAQRALEMVNAAKDASYKYNDFGSVLGAQDEFEDIYNDLACALRSTARRSRRLKNRIDKWEAGERTATLL